MERKPDIDKSEIKTLLTTRYMKVADIPFGEGKHYFVASRRETPDMTFMRSDEEYAKLVADAVTCFVIIELPDSEPLLLLNYEYRYPCGRFLLSPTAGLIDPSDLNSAEPLFDATRREIAEETGITSIDRMYVVSPLVFSTPGVTDESNALVCAVCKLPDLSCLNRDGAEKTECFGDFVLVNREEALEILGKGLDPRGGFMPLYTWAALMHFAYAYKRG